MHHITGLDPRFIENAPIKVKLIDIERNFDIFGLFWLLQPIFYQSYQSYQSYQIFQTSEKTG